MAELRKERMKKLQKITRELKKKIISLIKEDFSPQQIEGRLKLENHPFASHETIYKIIRKNKEEGGKLYKHCRCQLKHRKRPAGEKIPLKNRVSIGRRPDAIDLKQRFGGGEIDTVAGENNRGATVTRVERQSAFMMIEKLENGKNAKKLTKAFIPLQETTEWNLLTMKILLNY
ncbi:MAG: IS30 family transposase [Prevotellaceae bacterium]|jgi:IS30 family transposase|nr:IS30 family transposase [Prevotellaceae bacterium]